MFLKNFNSTLLFNIINQKTKISELVQKSFSSQSKYVLENSILSVKTIGHFSSYPIIQDCFIYLFLFFSVYFSYIVLSIYRKLCKQAITIPNPLEDTKKQEKEEAKEEEKLFKVKIQTWNTHTLIVYKVEKKYLSTWLNI